VGGVKPEVEEDPDEWVPSVSEKETEGEGTDSVSLTGRGWLGWSWATGR
jgi:hypothetical protein